MVALHCGCTALWLHRASPPTASWEPFPHPPSASTAWCRPSAPPSPRGSRRSQGVRIVTDERATSAASSVGDDAGAIADLIARLTAGTKDLPAGFRMTPVQFEKVRRWQRVGWQCLTGGGVQEGGGGSVEGRGEWQWLVSKGCLSTGHGC